MTENDSRVELANAQFIKFLKKVKFLKKIGNKAEFHKACTELEGNEFDLGPNIPVARSTIASKEL